MELIPPNKTVNEFQAVADQAHTHDGINNYHLQILAHCYFISSGLWLWCCWVLSRLLRPGSNNAAKERIDLVRRFGTYLDLLRRWRIVDLEFIGFDEAALWHGSVIAPNHPSIIDFMLLMTSVPFLDCVMNAKLLSNPVTSGGARLCDFILNDPLRCMVKACKERLASGANILIFPEGTRTMTPPLGAFHHSYVLAAKYSSAPIRTIIIECDSDYFGHRFSYFKPAKCPIRFRITAGRVFETSPSTCARSLSKEIERYFHSLLVEGIEQ
jgi:1-acyl-sn-glycerol-3-phosphate acyltransferase